MLSYTYRHRVRYRECDPMGIVYHTHFLDYFEAARTEALRAWGVAYKDLETSGIIMPVTEVQMRFHQPARYDDLLEIKTIFAEPPGVRVSVTYEVRRAGETRLLVTGKVVLCFVDTARNRPVTAPPEVAEAFDQAHAAHERVLESRIA